MRILLTLEYDGTNYAGWQRQENALAVQQVAEEAVSKLVGKKTVLFGASRTDAGVHALGQRAHFDADSPHSPGQVRLRPQHHAAPRYPRAGKPRVPDAFHARFSAVGKRYRYQIYAAPHAGALNRNTHAHVIYPWTRKRCARNCPRLWANTTLPPSPPAAAWSRTRCAQSPAQSFLAAAGIRALYRGHGLFVQYGAHHCRHAHRRGHGQVGAGRVFPRARLKEPARPGRHRPRARTYP